MSKSNGVSAPLGSPGAFSPSSGPAGGASAGAEGNAVAFHPFRQAARPAMRPHTLIHV